ncbi:unnamed protein product [Adineta steineri]|uniref:Uncharacterized protein n=1 Tax=Adineta steineri TaxID=433720 RepID=A0A814RLV9_9BILA|nr:unnamed protein product [Adineta steineri]CAF1528840.1 unnamed protein product [Adineta steineri]
MSSNHSDTNTLPIYKLYFDDIEELFFNTIPFKYLFITTITTFILIILSLIILLYRSKTIFFPSLIPFIYSLIFYDFIQILSIVLLKYNLLNINEKYFSELCRWPYYLKASSEAGQYLTLIFIYGIRYQKVRYFLKHNHLPNSSPIHSRALTFVCLLFIVYVNNWITHLKVEKIHLITYNQFNHEINIQEYPMTVYGLSGVKLNNHSQFYSDLDKYAQHYQNTSNRQTKSQKIILPQTDYSSSHIIIKGPYEQYFGEKKTGIENRTRSHIIIKDPYKKYSGENKPGIENRTRPKQQKKTRQKLNKTIIRKNSYRIHRCTYGQRNFFLANFLSLIHSIFYFLLIIYFLTTIYRYQIPYMTIDCHQKLYDKALSLGQKKSAERYRQLILLTRLRYFQYLIVYCHTTFIIIRLIYICSLTILLCFVQAPFKFFLMKIFFYSIFCIVYYSIPLRITLLFLYLFFNLFSSYIYSIFYYIFCTKLHFSCKLQKPSIRFSLHIVQYNQRERTHDEHSTNSFVLDLTSSVYEEHSTIYPNESIVVYEENSSGQQMATTSNFPIINQLEQTML